MTHLDSMTAAEFQDLQERFRTGKLKANEAQALRIEARRCRRDTTMLISDDFREELEMLARTLGEV